MTTAAIRTAFETAVASWATANSLTVAWQNVVTRTEATQYLRCFVLPAIDQIPNIEQTGRIYSGVFQVDFVESLGGGTAWGESKIVLLSTAVGLKLVTASFSIHLLNPLSLISSGVEDGRYVSKCSALYSATSY
jgi:Bacteriophage related domain of unknown function